MRDEVPATPPAESAGVPIAAGELAASEPAPPPVDRIVGPLLCVQCHYDLATLTHAQRCPECGMPAAETLASIAAAPVVEHLKLRRGLLLIAIAMIGGISWIVTGQISLGYFVFSMIGTGVPDWVMFALSIVVPCLSAAWVTVSALGWWRITLAVREMLPTRARTATIVGRLAWLYMFAYISTGVGTAVISVANLGPNGGVEVAISAAAFLTLCIWVVRTSLGFGLLADIAASCRARRLSGLLRFLVWATIGLSVVFSVCWIVGPLLNTSMIDFPLIGYLFGGSGVGLLATILAFGLAALALRRAIRPFARGASR